MRRIAAFLLAVLLCCGLTACSKKESGTALSTDNIGEYALFDAKVSDIVRWSVFDGASNTTKTGFKSCVVTVNVFANQAITVQDGTVTFDLVPDDDRYKTLTDQTLTLSENGTAMGTFTYEDKQEGDTPSFTVRVTAASGVIQQ